MGGAKINKTKFKKAVNGTGGILSQIAIKLDVSRKTLYEYIRKEGNAWTADILKHERERIVDMGEGALFKKVKEEDPWAVKYLLSTVGKSRGYTEKQEIEHSGLDSIRVTIDDPMEDKPKD